MGAPLKKWAEDLQRHWPQGRWITREDVDLLLAGAAKQTVVRPQLARLLEHPVASSAVKRLPADIRAAFDLLIGGLRVEARIRNETFLQNELVACRAMFDRIERKPLTDEQARAVVCFDNRVLLIAAAGSGKTSTLVAKAGYALHRSLVTPDEILMLAFNRDAAKELGERIRDRLDGIVPDPKSIEARTFHALGLSVIGHATGRKPTLAPWIERDNGMEEMSSIIAHLRASDVAFRAEWALYKFVYADDVRKFGSREEPEDWDKQSGVRGFRTHNDDVVSSKEERTIADWLHFNGVRYVYEGRYERETADATHGQYHPDFYYPDAQLYHEHFALDENGKPPDHFEGYLDGVHWKRQLHTANGTSLYETTSAGLRAGTALDDLARELNSRGIVLDPSEDRPVKGRPIPPDRELSRAIRVFQVHAKSNRLGMTELRQRLSERSGLGLHGRHLVFLELYERISAEWERRLAANNLVDFEDMLNQAADHIESGRWRSPYRLVLVDEFQDASQARARLIQALVRRPGRYLCAVGDDWQGINRFAGADIKVMSHFEEIFGEADTRYLATTFRCPQALCDLSGAFVSRNPDQIAKTVKSTNLQTSVAVVCHTVAEDTGIEPLVEAHLRKLSERVKSGEVERGPQKRVTVFVLGRYWHNQPSKLEQWREEFAPSLQVTFSTIHGAKGLEADYVCIVGLTQGRYGFPSQVEDDPVYQLAMPEVESYPFAEERRLFYVALTRARRLVLLYTVESRVSQFLVELQGDPYRVPIQRSESTEISKACPACGRGLLVRRLGRHGQFWGCSRFPACNHTVDDGGGRSQRRQRRAKSRG